MKALRWKKGRKYRSVQRDMWRRRTDFFTRKRLNYKSPEVLSINLEVL